MITENKIKCILMDFEINNITLQEATKQILRLLSDVGRIEQCNHKFERVEKGGEFQGNQCDCGEWEDLT